MIFLALFFFLGPFFVTTDSNWNDQDNQTYWFFLANWAISVACVIANRFAEKALARR